MTVLGDGAVGKTTLVKKLLRMTDKSHHNQSDKKILNNKKISRTPFIEIESWKYENIVFQCYDLAGQRNPGMHPLDLLQNQVLKFIDIYIFVFALNRYESFENLNNWCKLINLGDDLRNSDDRFILVGNKIDLERNVSRELVNTLIGEDNFFHIYVETSPISGIGMDDLLNKIVQLSKKLLSSCD